MPAWSNLRLTLVTGLAIAASFADDAHAAANVKQLTDFSRQARAKVIAGRTPLYYALLASTDPAQMAVGPGLELMYIGKNGVPAYYQTVNESAARTVRTWDVWPVGVGGGFFGVSGSTTAPGELAVWDSGGVKGTHQEFGGRVTQMDVPENLSQHATHVAGTLIAGGVNPAARGMSYQAPLHAYDWRFDLSEMAGAAAGNLEISNHSYAHTSGFQNNRWYGDITVSIAEDYGFGFYDDDAHDFDEVAWLAPEYLIVLAAGNDRDDVWGGTHMHWDGSAWVVANDFHGADFQHGGYDTISWFTTAKNGLVVGAVDDIPGGYTDPSSVVMMPFSSWGPCDDGRIKPDIVANGYFLLSTDTVGTASYFSGTGTSMAAPNAAGSINLIAQDYEARFGARPRSSTLKALVINTADEAGASDGPDYSFGWGLLNTYRAIDLVRAVPSADRGLLERTLSSGDTHTFNFEVDSPGPVRVTIAWTDPPGTPPPASVDPPDKMLVNDLDVRIASVGGGVTTLPWSLDRLNPSAAPTQTDNSIDNVESIDIALAPGDDYVVTVTNKNALSGGSQDYALVWQGLVLASTVGVGPHATPAFRLDLPVPHPIHARATIGFHVDRDETVSIAVYDVQGRRVRTLVERGTRASGAGTVELDASRLASGVYFLKMQTPTRTVSRKITIVK